MLLNEMSTQGEICASFRGVEWTWSTIAIKMQYSQFVKNKKTLFFYVTTTFKCQTLLIYCMFRYSYKNILGAMKIMWKL